MATNYQRGRSAEWEAQHRLEEQAFTVTRSASSKSPWDLTAIGGSPSHVRLVQCKRSKVNIVSLQAVETAFGDDLKKLRAIPHVENVFKELWLKIDRKGWRWFDVTTQRLIEMEEP